MATDETPIEDGLSAPAQAEEEIGLEGLDEEGIIRPEPIEGGDEISGGGGPPSAAGGMRSPSVPTRE